MDALTLRPTTAQLRSLVLTTCACGLVAVLLMREHLAGHDESDHILGWGVAAATVMLLIAGVTVAYCRAVTECTEAGIRVRGLGLERRWRWDQVTEVGIRVGSRGITRTVILTLTGGVQVLLGAPVTGGLMRDRDFDRKVREIRQFWRHAIGMGSGGGPVPVLPPMSYRVAARSAIVGLVTLTALGLTAALPVTVREGGQALLVRFGEGQPGYFTGYFYSCGGGSCAWVGNFTASNSPARQDSVTIAPGASIPSLGSRVPAVDTGAASLVYPAGGGTDWIPLVTTLAVLAGCLAVDALWVTSRIRQRRAEIERQPGRDPPAAAVGAGGPARPVLPRRAMARTAFMSGAACLVVAGTVAAVLLLPLPSAAPSAAARACADYGEWLAAYTGSSQPWTDRAALERATQVAPAGALAADLGALAYDVNTAAEFGQSSAGDAALASMVTDIHAVGHDCFG